MSALCQKRTWAMSGIWPYRTRVEAPSQARVSKPKFRFVVIFLRRIPFSPMDLERASVFLLAHRSFDARCCRQSRRDQMKTQCLLRQNQYHTTAWINGETTKLGLLVEIPALGGRWEIVEIYPYRLTDKQLKTHKALIVS